MLSRTVPLRRLATTSAGCARRTVIQQPRIIRPSNINRPFARHQSSVPTPQPATGGALAGGVIGGSLVLVGFYSWYHFSGAKTTLNTANSAMSSFQSAKQSFIEATPEPNEALQWLRSTATSYAALLPGGKQAVNKVFDDIDKVRERRGDKIDKTVTKAYEDLKGVLEKGKLDADTARRFWNVLERSMEELTQIAKEAGQDVLEQHPELQEKLGGGVETLRKYGESYGPEAKKVVDDTWKKVLEIWQGGLSKDNIEKAKKLIEEKTKEVQKMGNKAWDKGMETAQPYLKKNPTVKKLVEENKDKLLKEGGNVEELFEQATKAAKDGNTDSLEKFIGKALGDMKGKGEEGLQGILGKIPDGKEMTEKFVKLQKLAQSKGSEAEKLAKEAFQEIKGILQKKLEEGEKLAEETKEQGKKEAKK